MGDNVETEKDLGDWSWEDETSKTRRLFLRHGGRVQLASDKQKEAGFQTAEEGLAVSTAAIAGSWKECPQQRGAESCIAIGGPAAAA